MPRSVAIRSLVIAALVALPVSYGCSSDVGVVPLCTPNVDENGVVLGVEDGCVQFAICAENPDNPATCCTDVMTDEGKFSTCLFGYGRCPAGFEQSCSCDRGTRGGTRICAADGKSFGECSCAGGGTGGSGTGGAGGGS